MMVDRIKGRAGFRLTGFEPYVRKDGGLTELALWEGRCARCNTPFVVKTPGRIAALSAAEADQRTKSFGAIHCPAHRLSAQEATARWIGACAAGRRRQRASHPS